eukprot:6372289-Amphidinium_carterae.1
MSGLHLFPLSAPTFDFRATSLAPGLCCFHIRTLKARPQGIFPTVQVWCVSVRRQKYDDEVRAITQEKAAQRWCEAGELSGMTTITSQNHSITKVKCVVLCLHSVINL